MHTYIHTYIHSYIHTYMYPVLGPVMLFVLSEPVMLGDMRLFLDLQGLRWNGTTRVNIILQPDTRSENSYTVSALKVSPRQHGGWNPQHCMARSSLGCPYIDAFLAFRFRMQLFETLQANEDLKANVPCVFAFKSVDCWPRATNLCLSVMSSLLTMSKRLYFFAC